MVLRAMVKSVWARVGPVAPAMLAALFGVASASQAGTPIRGAAYVAELQTERLYRVAFRWDGTGQLTVDTPRLIVTTNAGGGVHFADDVVYVTGAGTVTRVELATAGTSSSRAETNDEATGRIARIEAAASHTSRRRPSASRRRHTPGSSTPTTRSATGPMMDWSFISSG